MIKLDKAIIVENLSKKYKLYYNSKERLFDLITPKEYGEDFYALKDVSFEANQGDIVGFIGINGSGKSTLSNIISGIIPETTGTVNINGTVSLIAVAAGLKNDLTGRDNIELKLLMLGFNKKEIQTLEQSIIDFSELEKFIDQPVKSYSSGMKSRLGFSISVNIDPDILIIDEALSVGDKAFAEKSLEKMNEFKESGKTMIFVSHSITQMRNFCDKILWLEFGKVKEYGDVDEVLPNYERFLNNWKKLSKKERELYREKVLLDENVNIDFFIDSPSEKPNYEEKYISKLGKLRDNSIKLYRNLKNLNDYMFSGELYGKTLYIKKLSVINNQKYYLLSREPSSEKGVIGWVHVNDVIAHNLVFIENVTKTFQIIDEGKGFSIPWGSEKDIIFDNVYEYKDEVFYVNRIEKLRNGYWCGGTFKNKQVWINYKRVKAIESKN